MLLALLVSASYALDKCVNPLENGEWDIVTISRAKGGLGFTAFGATYVKFHTKSKKTPLRITHGNSPQELKQNRPGLMRSFWEALFSDPQTEISLEIDPTNDHYFSVQKMKNLFQTNEQLCYKAGFSLLSFWRVAPLIIGLGIFFKARSVTEQIAFHYASGISMGVVMFAIGLLFVVTKIMIPKRGMVSFWGIFLGGSTFVTYFMSKFYVQAYELIETYPIVVMAYVIIAASLSFAACYWYEDSLRHPRYQKLSCWFLQFIGVMLIVISSWNIKLNILIGTVVLVRELMKYGRRHGTFTQNVAYNKSPSHVKSRLNTTQFSQSPPSTPKFNATKSMPSTPLTPNFFSPIANLRKLPMRFGFMRNSEENTTPEKKFLTMAEYEEQGEKETNNAIEALKESIQNSPNPWKVLSKLSKDTQSKLINFMDTGDHLAKDSEELFNDITDSEDEEDSAEEQRQQSRLTQPTFSSLNKIHQNSPKRIIHRASYGAEQRTTSFNGTSKIPQQKRWR
ncbi:Oidioi.mRNA.OKI2018_I69.PAR.g11671.t1.cds [Oikopleura dioica]|uniref:Oidioi.mRNA.OKI2018_I69.PAR.g11671.t1.cds n=1 Tax=Oikopleura dioica TaxID=34765 RepID=A0ABN7RX71_OIKDI|nr:Oidioi.mRNA.OKI2018_I69.PAR.g11671.t1.cds [Oikopleura dioica]